jgi:predicted ATPase
VVIDEFDPTTHYWGLKGSSKTFVKRLEKCIKGEFNHRDLYTASAQAYLLNIDIKLFRNEFSTEDAGVLFRYFDNLKTLEMLATIEADLSLIDGGKADLNYFSDGQFQSVYIYSITEIFKNSNSITLLDEPDSFLHPEWQFEFLSQISEISEQAIKTNQVFMTSHSAATLMSAPSPQLNSLQVCDNGSTEISLVSKFDVIKRLSGNKIFLDENESIMNISTFVKNSTQPVLFTEGISDEYILGVAWKKLYPGVNRPFCIHNAFDRGFLRNLFIRNELRNSFPERTLFALFDFDDAYEDWKVLSKGGITEIDNPFNGLTTKMKHEYHYAMLLPVPNVAAVKKQVLKADDTPWGKGTESHLAIELLFFNENLVGTWFDKKATSGGGEIIKFKSDKLKVKFAEEFVPSLPAVDFEIFRPMFEFIVAKTNTVDTELAVLEAS